MLLGALQGEGDEEEAKRRRQSARGYQKKFHSSHGDAIAAVNVLCAYEQSASPDAFCRFVVYQQFNSQAFQQCCLFSILFSYTAVHDCQPSLRVCSAASVNRSVEAS